MSDVGGIAGDRLRSFIERIERLNEEEDGIKADKREVFAEAKGCGFDPKVMRQCIRARKMDASERQEQEEIFDVYMRALEGSGTSVANNTNSRTGAQARVAREATTSPHDTDHAMMRHAAMAQALGHDPETGEIAVDPNDPDFREVEEKPPATEAAPEAKDGAVSEHHAASSEVSGGHADVIDSSDEVPPRGEDIVAPSGDEPDGAGCDEEAHSASSHVQGQSEQPPTPLFTEGDDDLLDIPGFLNRENWKDGHPPTDAEAAE